MFLSETTKREARVYATFQRNATFFSSLETFTFNMPTLTAKQIHRDSRKMLGRSPEVIKSFNETLPRSSDRLRQAVRVFNGIHASPAYQRRASFTAHVHAFNVSTDARSILHDLRTSFTVLGRFSSGDGRRLFRARYEIPPDWLVTDEELHAVWTFTKKLIEICY